MPYVEKTITRRDFSREQGRGWGDAELTARYRLWKTGPMSGRHIAGLQAGVRAPTGDTVRNNQGQVLNIDAQPDAGAAATLAIKRLSCQFVSDVVNKQGDIPICGAAAQAQVGRLVVGEFGIEVEVSLSAGADVLE